MNPWRPPCEQGHLDALFISTSIRHLMRTPSNVIPETTLTTSAGISSDVAIDRRIEELQDVLDAIPAMVWFKDTENRILSLNQAAATAVGRLKHEILGARTGELFPHEAAIHQQQDLSVIRSQQPILGYIESLRLSDGRKRWFRTDRIPTFSDNGLVSGVIVVSTDVTELKAKEQELGQSRQRYARAIAGSTDGLWEWQVGTDTVYYSPRFSQLLGFTPEEWGDRLEQFRSHLHPDDNDRVWHEVELHLAENTHYDIRYRLLTKQGEYRWFRARGNAVRDVNGNPLLMSGTIQDIDNLVCAEEALQRVHRDLEQKFSERTLELRQSESKYQELYDHSPEMHVSVDPATRIVVECNKTLLHALGYAKSEIVGMKLFDLCHPDSRDQAAQAIDVFRTDGEIAEAELMLARKDGSRLDVSLRVTSVCDDRGALRYIRLSCRDITQRKNAEHLLKQREDELAHVSRLATMGEMAAGLAHELNQPLYSIANYARGSVLRMDSETIDIQQLREIAEEIASEAERAGEIIRRMRRMVQKRDPLETEFDVNAVVRDACQLLAADLRRLNVSLEFSLDPANPRAYSDDVQLQQIVVNLIRNSIEAMMDTPLDQRICHVSTFADNGEVCVAVADRGCGVKEGEHERMFDAFHTTSDTGMGMGLAISRSIVELHDGRIWATTNPGGGATVQFTIPVLARE